MEEYVGHEETIGNVKLKIICDSDPMSPREWDNAGVMVCEHRNYNLGDDNGRDAAKEAVRASSYYRESWESYDAKGMLDLDYPPSLWAAIRRCADIIAYPLYLYDHSGITIRMSEGGGNPFSCQWDSGQVGFTFMTKAKALEEWGNGGTRLTPAIRAKATACMKGEVETYDMYLTGDVWGYVVEDEDGDELDACWGYYGLEDAIEQGQHAAKSCDTQGILELA